MCIYEEKSLLFKALADSTRLKIVNMLSCNELCACMILEKFNITQPTLSHHMRILCECSLVNGRKEGKWTYYSLNEKTVQAIKSFLTEVTSCKEQRICGEELCYAKKPCCEEDAE